jgi:hypothetical protein
MADISNEKLELPLKSKRTAMLVIHGIGEQNPYETLDSFAKGVFSYLQKRPGVRKVELSPVETALEDWTQVGMRITVNPDLDPSLQGRVDLFEYYWAPETEDKLSWKDTLKWVLRTDLTPLRYFADNLQEMMGARGASAGSAIWYSLKLYARELLRVLFFYVPLALISLWLLSWLSHPAPLWKSLNGIRTTLQPYLVWPQVVVLACFALALLMTIFMLQSLLAYLNRRRQTMQRSAEGLWFVLALLSAGAFYAVGLFLPFFFSQFAVDMQAFLKTLSGIWTAAAPAVLVVLLAAALRYILTAYVADVAVYVSSDAKSKNYVARSAILKGSTAALKRILKDLQYDRVILAGHSLGSVIAYDTINELLAQFNAEDGPGYDKPIPELRLSELQKLQGLITFGSPLDKIYYFFREHVNEDQAIRAQILSMLHSFRKVRSGRDYSPYQFQVQYAFTQLDTLVWMNAYAFMDPVGGRLKFYDLKDSENQKSFRYWKPGLAHLSYWGDPNFYLYFGQKLL